MEIYYQGTEITPFVKTRRAVVRDTCGARCDSLELEFDYAEGWYRWGVKADDQIRVTHNGYDSGILYLHSVIPEEGNFRFFATALPYSARNKEFRSFRGKTVLEIMRQCAMTSRMDQRVFGIDENTVIPYIQQNNETAAAFLDRLLTMESAKLKCINGRYTAIGLEYAQQRPAVKTLEISANQSGGIYLRSGTRTKTLTMETPFACATAEDSQAESAWIQARISDRPALSDVQAGRWARGLLWDINRKTEKLILDTTFDPNLSAMVRFDVTGGTDADGEWIVETAEHDLIGETSKAEMYRCITTI